MPDASPADTIPLADEPAAPAPEPDYWELRGHSLILHIRAPRRRLFRPTDDLKDIPIPIEQVDVTRDFW